MSQPLFAPTPRFFSVVPSVCYGTRLLQPVIVNSNNGRPGKRVPRAHYGMSKRLSPDRTLNNNIIMLYTHTHGRALSWNTIRVKGRDEGLGLEDRIKNKDQPERKSVTRHVPCSSTHRESFIYQRRSPSTSVGNKNNKKEKRVKKRKGASLILLSVLKGP